MSGPMSAKQALRSRLEEHLKKQEEEQKKELLRKRIEIAKEGATLYHQGKYIEALKFYQRYLLILELWKKCGRDALTPELFDKTRDLYELVLISGVYWDLARLYDRGRKPHQIEELKKMLKKYVLFSKGFPYQPLSSEALRRYLGSGKCQHSELFKSAYKELSGDSCFVATYSLPEISWSHYEKWRLRRDLIKKFSVLNKPVGSGIVGIYEKWSPKLIRILDSRILKFGRRPLRALIRFILEKI